MRFGVCTGAEQARLLAQAGYDYIELGVSGALSPEQPEEEVMPALHAALAGTGLAAETYNVLLPGNLKVVGPDTDPVRQGKYLEEAFRRAASLGGQVAVFGSGGSRRIPAGWARAEAQGQAADFLRLCGAAAARHGMAVAVEPLNLSECNFLNSVAEAAALVQEAGHPAVGVLSDLYHVTQDGHSYSETREAPGLRHVHVAGAGRRAPAAEDYEYLRGYFAVLKGRGYDARVSIEGQWDDMASQAAASLAVLRRAWAEA